MRWWPRLRRKKKDYSFIDPDNFGRYSEAFKSDDQYALWDEALRLFEEGKRFSAYRHFLNYLRNNKGSNIKIEMGPARLRFELIQGSQKLNGEISPQWMTVSAFLAREENYPAPLLMELLEENYHLKFCKYALSGDHALRLVAEGDVRTMSPYKLFHLLKETALTADKKDDLIYSKYGLTNPVAARLHIDRPVNEKNACYTFIKRTFHGVSDFLKEGPLPPNEYPGLVRYMILAAAYKVDFLVCPEAVLMDLLEQCDRLGFTNDPGRQQETTRQLMHLVEEILQLGKDQVFEELYRTEATFSINPVLHSAQIRSIIYSELGTMDWYLEKGHFTAAEAITDFIVGYLLFNFSVPPVCKELLLLYYRIRERAFFRSLGYRDLPFEDPDQMPRLVRQEVRRIVKRHARQFPFVEPEYAALEFSSRYMFYKTYLEMLAEMNFTPK